MEFFRVDNLSVPFNSNWNNVAISLSGGADSTLLAFLICNEIIQKNLNHITVHIISHKRCWKTKPWQEYDSLKIYNWLSRHFSKVNFQRHTNFIAPDLEYAHTGPSITDEYRKTVSGDNIQIRAFAEYICHVHNIDAYYNAVTRNPKNVSFTGMPERDIEPNESNQHLAIMKHMGRWAVHPFRFVEKSWIIKQYYKLEIEDLLHATRSCEGEIPGIDFQSYTPYQYVPVCGECFWCKEREWAIEQNK
jgi:7-cyano-7-deazaguanine synthase in queuosine biosynthesis